MRCRADAGICAGRADGQFRGSFRKTIFGLAYKAAEHPIETVLSRPNHEDRIMARILNGDAALGTAIGGLDRS